MEIDLCPFCGVSLTGTPIPEKDRPSFGGRSHFTRKIGIYDTAADRTIEWECPDCKKRWPREMIDNQNKPNFFHPRGDSTAR